MGEITRIIVWNMQGFSSQCDNGVKNRRVEILEAMLREHDPSLFALQEAFDDLEVRLSAVTRSKYAIVLGYKESGLVSGYQKSAWTEFDKCFRHKTIGVTMVSLRHAGVPDTFVRFWNVHLPRNEPGKEEHKGAVVQLRSALEEKRRAKRAKEGATEILQHGPVR
jgi:exonuclease III